LILSAIASHASVGQPRRKVNREHSCALGPPPQFLPKARRPRRIRVPMPLSEYRAPVSLKYLWPVVSKHSDISPCLALVKCPFHTLTFFNFPKWRPLACTSIGASFSFCTNSRRSTLYRMCPLSPGGGETSGSQFTAGPLSAIQFFFPLFLLCGLIPPDQCPFFHDSVVPLCVFFYPPSFSHQSSQILNVLPLLQLCAEISRRFRSFSSLKMIFFLPLLYELSFRAASFSPCSSLLSS